MENKPDITYALSPEEYGTYEVGEEVVIRGLTFVITEVINHTTVRLNVHATGWQRFKQWLKVKSTFPTWLMVKTMTPFLPKKHPWYKRKFTQVDWYVGATDYTKVSSYVIWCSALSITMLLIKIWSLQ